MAIQIKAGNGVPTTSNLANKQLGYNKDNRHLYINDNGIIVDLNFITMYTFTDGFFIYVDDNISIQTEPNNYFGIIDLSSLISAPGVTLEIADIKFYDNNDNLYPGWERININEVKFNFGKYDPGFSSVKIRIYGERKSGS